MEFAPVLCARGRSDHGERIGLDECQMNAPPTSKAHDDFIDFRVAVAASHNSHPTSESRRRRKNGRKAAEKRVEKQLH